MNVSDKKHIVQLLLDQYNDQWELLVKSTQQAQAYATDEESRAENKYDTRGLEASYLAFGQAQRAEELKLAIATLEKLPLKDFKGSAIESTALIEVDVEGEGNKWFLMLASNGGSRLDYNGWTVQVVTPGSPLGGQLFGKKPGDSFELRSGSDGAVEYEVLQVV